MCTIVHLLPKNETLEMFIANTFATSYRIYPMALHNVSVWVEKSEGNNVFFAKKNFKISMKFYVLFYALVITLSIIETVKKDFEVL